MRIKMLSCNVNGRVRAAQGRQMACLLDRKPDILALQEVTVGSYPDWCRRLTQAGYSVVSSVELVALPYPAPPYPTPPFPPPQRGSVHGHVQRTNFNLSAARHPIAMLPGLSFEDPVEARYAFPEKYVASRVAVDGIEVDVHNAHLPPGVSRGAIKAHAFEAISRRLDKDPGHPKVLCGDFNAPWGEDASGPISKFRRKWPEDVKARWIAAERAVFATPDLRDVYRDVHDPGEPFPASHFTGRTARRYDYIFATSDLETQTCRYLNGWLDGDEPHGRLSDHAPVEAELSPVGPSS